MENLGEKVNAESFIEIILCEKKRSHPPKPSLLTWSKPQLPRCPDHSDSNVLNCVDFLRVVKKVTEYF